MIDLPPPKYAPGKPVEDEVRPCKIMLIGEAPGEEEAFKGKPFVGPSGWVLNKMLRAAGINRNDCSIVNTFRRRPLNNDIGAFFVKRLPAKRAGYKSRFPVHSSGFVHPELEPELDRLHKIILQFPASVLVPMGATALWAVTGESKIGNFRGSVLHARVGDREFRTIPTYHPAAVLRLWENFSTVVSDLRKALLESARPAFARRTRNIYLYPNLGDLDNFYGQHISLLRDTNKYLSVDLETRWDVDHQITCVCLAPDPENALVLPFWHAKNPDLRYWSAQDEPHAWAWLAKIMSDPTIPKLFQNGSYDVQVLAHWGIRTEGEYHDTMILHHALEPELPKSLDYLASVYCDEVAWKSSINFKTDKVDA